MKQAASPSPTKERSRPPRASGVVEFPAVAKKRARTDTRATRAASPEKSRAACRLPKVSSSSSTSSPTTATIDTGEELEVVKCVLVREGYLQRLARASADGKVNGTHLGETVDVLDLVRVATLETIESIVTWRTKVQRRSGGGQEAAPYLWNGVNYLLKIPSDLEFLSKHTALTQWLGFTLERNPFVLPVNLDCRTKLGEAVAHSPERPTINPSDDSSRFIEVGGKRASESARVDAAAAAAAWALAERKRAKNPYETRVVNDDELIPTATLLPASKTKDELRPATRDRRRHQVNVLPSQIGDLDMARIQDAEVVLLEEETRYGSLARDWQGRIVSAAEAQRRANMMDMSGGAYATTNSTGSSHQAEDDGGDLRSESRVSPVNQFMTGGGSTLQGKFIAKKRAGALGPISKTHSAIPITKNTGLAPNNHLHRLPVRSRSRGAQFEDALETERRALQQLEGVMDALREQIERKEMDVAYFESIPGLQHLGDELSELAAASRTEALELRHELKEKRAVWERKRDNIARKRDIVETYKTAQKTSVDDSHRSRIDACTSSGGAVEDGRLVRSRPSSSSFASTAPARGTFPAPTVVATQATAHQQAVQHLCATTIQAHARGMLARAAFVRMQVAFVVASTFIQAGARGFLTRRRVAKLFWQRTAVVVLQRVARGMLARLRVRKKRLALQIQRSAREIQRIVRGRLGRVRMLRIRRLFAARSGMVSAVMDEGVELSISASDLKELAAECAKMVAVPMLTGTPALDCPLSSLVLGLVRVLMLFTSDRDGEWDVPNSRWREASQFLGCSVSLLRRMQKIGLAASDAKRHIRGSTLGCSLLNMLASDRAFNLQQFEALPRGAKAACAIFQWVTAYEQVSRLQSVLPDRNGTSSDEDDTSGTYFVVAKELSAGERALERTEAKENAISEEASERRFVPVELLFAVGVPGKAPRSNRSRAVLLVVGRDLPTRAKRSLLGRLMAALPGRFVTINRCRDDVDNEAKQSSLMTTLRSRPSSTASRAREGIKEVSMFDIGAIRAAVALGYSVVLEGDVGLRDPTQRQFLSALAAVKAAIHPSPHCILLQGSAQNRPEPADDCADSDQWEQHAAAADADLKIALESAAEHLFSLKQRQAAKEMLVMSSASDDPAAEESLKAPAALVIAMEAVIVLLTPGKTYTGPTAQAPVVSWRLARRLLANPRFLQLKLAQVRAEAVPRDNLSALNRYISHPSWPTRHQALSLQLQAADCSTGNDTLIGRAHLVFALASWVESIVALAHLIADGNGIAGEVTRSSPVLGLFGSVVTYCNVGKRNAIQDVASDDQDDPVRDIKASADAIAEGEGDATRELLQATLADACVYRAAHALDNGERCVISVFHDCRRIFFSAYAPSSSRRWLTAISESSIDTLLAPNSLERMDTKRPPATQAELYDRLLRLCVLQSGGGSVDNALVSDNSRSLTMGGVSLPTATDNAAQLVVRPRAVRLLRRVMRIGGFLVTLTLSELSRGRVQVDAFIHCSDLTSGIFSDGHRRLIPANNVGGSRTVVGLESILERLSADRAHFVAAVSPPRLANMVLDRLHMFCALQSRSKRSNQSAAGSRAIPAVVAHQLLATCASDGVRGRELTVRIRVRTKEAAPGRVLVRRAVWLPRNSETGCGGKETKELWLLSVVEMHAEQSFAAQLYHPKSSRRLAVTLSARDMQDFVRVSRFTSPLRLQKSITRVFHFTFSDENDEETEDEDDSCSEDGEVVLVTKVPTKHSHPVARRLDGLVVRRVLARFPSALRHEAVPHQLVSKTTRRVRVYVQVEPCEADMAERGLLFRIYEPETCEEHNLKIRDCEIETWMAENQSWARASTEQRARISRELARSTFEWCGGHESSGCVSVRLPSGVITSCRVSRQQKNGPSTAADQCAAVCSDSTSADAQVASSCVVLLDEDEPERDDVTLDAGYSALRPSKWCFPYDKEELVHRGTHRANGQMLMVRVLMKVVIRERLVPLVPMDRVLQEDVLVITFQIYHPATSSHATVEIDGRHELREVVGPDKSSLISSFSIRALISHIIEARTEVQLVDPDVNTTPSTVSTTSVMQEHRAREQHKHQRKLRIVFLRDRLYAKYKATPITTSFEGDAEVNAVKLIDHAADRGVKVLSRAKVLAGCGRVILTFFDIAGHHHPGPADLNRRWRVDAYVCSTSERLSLVLEPADLLHVVGDRTELLLLNAANMEPTESSEEDRRQLQRELALVVIDHVGIEQRRDGRSSRLFLSEYYLPPPLPSKHQGEGNKAERELVFKAVRAVEDTQVVMFIYLVHSAELSMLVELYEPRASATSTLELPLPTLAAMFGLSETLASSLLTGDPEAIAGLSRSAIMAHISAFIRVSKLAEDQLHLRQVEVEAVMVHPALLLDAAQARVCVDRLVSHRGDQDSVVRGTIESAAASMRVLQRWVGPIAGLDGRYLCLCLHLIMVQDECSLLCSAYSPIALAVATAFMGPAELHGLDVALPSASDTAMHAVASDLLQRVGRLLRVEMVEQVEDGLETETESKTEVRSMWRLRVHAERWSE